MDGFSSKVKNATEIGIEGVGLLAGFAGPTQLPDLYQAPADSPHSICQTAASPQDAVSLWTTSTADSIDDLATAHSSEVQGRRDALADLGDALAPPESAEHAPPDAVLGAGPDGGMDSGMDGGPPAGGFF